MTKLSELPRAEAEALIREALAEFKAEQDAEDDAEDEAKRQANLAAYEAKKRDVDAKPSDIAARMATEGATDADEPVEKTYTPGKQKAAKGVWNISDECIERLSRPAMDSDRIRAAFAHKPQGLSQAPPWHGKTNAPWE